MQIRIRRIFQIKPAQIYEHLPNGFVLNRRIICSHVLARPIRHFFPRRLTVQDQTSLLQTFCSCGFFHVRSLPFISCLKC
ncbi:hypothetical protein ES071_10810 [Bacillus velezensis]|nr:hypothetical protein ES071_10810 [Bacillus velezensis]